MATFDLPPYKGSHDGFNYYKRNGKWVVRKAGGGFNSEAIKNNPKMQKVLQNSSEFGHCSSIKGQFRLALTPFLEDITDGSLHGRLMKLFPHIKNLDTISPAGKRTIKEGMKTARGKKELREFKFTPEVSVVSILGNDLIYEAETGILKAPGYDPKRITYPKGANGFLVQYAVVDFDFETGAYEGWPALTLEVDRDSPARELVLRPEKIPTNTGRNLAVVGIRFYQRLDGVVYELNGVLAKGVGVVEC